MIETNLQFWFIVVGVICLLIGVNIGLWIGGGDNK